MQFISREKEREVKKDDDDSDGLMVCLVVSYPALLGLLCCCLVCFIHTLLFVYLLLLTWAMKKNFSQKYRQAIKGKEEMEE